MEHPYGEIIDHGQNKHGCPGNLESSSLLEHFLHSNDHEFVFDVVHM